MSRIARFAEYAAAFEKAFESDDWSVLQPYFTEDAVYDSPLPSPFGGRPEGRQAVLDYFERTLDGLDRRFATRELQLLEGPVEEGDTVWVRGSATYRADGVPDFALELKETVHFEGDRIRLLEDEYTPEMTRRLVDYVREHGERLGISLD